MTLSGSTELPTEPPHTSTTPEEPPMVRRSTAILASGSAGMAGSIGSGSVQWLWAGDYEAMPAELAGVIGTTVYGAFALLVWLVYWWLNKHGVPAVPMGHRSIIPPQSRQPYHKAPHQKAPEGQGQQDNLQDVK